MICTLNEKNNRVLLALRRGRLDDGKLPSSLNTVQTRLSTQTAQLERLEQRTSYLAPASRSRPVSARVAWRLELRESFRIFLS